MMWAESPQGLANSNEVVEGKSAVEAQFTENNNMYDGSVGKKDRWTRDGWFAIEEMTATY